MAGGRGALWSPDPSQGTGEPGPALVPSQREAGCLSYTVTLPLRSFAERISTTGPRRCLPSVHGALSPRGQ